MAAEGWNFHLKYQKEHNNKRKKKLASLLNLMKLQEKELQKFSQFISEADRWREAKLLWEYVREVGESAAINGTADRIKDWSDWALRKIEWYDPLIQAEDSLMTEVNKDTITINEIPFKYPY